MVSARAVAPLIAVAAAAAAVLVVAVVVAAAAAVCLSLQWNDNHKAVYNNCPQSLVAAVQHSPQLLLLWLLL